MFNTLLNRVSPDSTPDAYGAGTDFHQTEFIIGLIVGIILTLLVVGTIKAIRSETKNNTNDKSDE